MQVYRYFFKVFGYRFKEKSGFIFKKETFFDLPPVSLLCKNCGCLKVLFDPQKDGYDGELGYADYLTESDELVELTSEYGLIAVTYTFQGLDNYEELYWEGVERLYDYFDTFSVFYILGDKTECIIDCECA